MKPPKLTALAACLLLATACLAAPASPSPTAAPTASLAPPAVAPPPTGAPTPTPIPPAPTLTPIPLTETPAPTATAEPSLTLMAVGDLMLARQLGERLAAGEVGYPFALVTDILGRADLTVGNLECAITEGGEPLAKAYRFRAPPPAAAALAQAGFDLVTLANNHALDFGPQGLADTQAWLGAAGVAAVGAGPNARAARAPVFLERNGLRVAFLGVADVPVERGGWDARTVIATGASPGLAWADLEQMAGDIGRARQLADLVVVLAHSGFEYREQPNTIQTAIGRAAIDAGAALVIGSHSHTLQGVEYYGSGVIAYSLGNFAFEIDASRDSAILQVTLTRQGVQRLEWLPVVLDPADGRPAPAEGAARDRILQTLERLTRELSSE